ncbi:MAG: aminotransferase class III-fold pyridoxal phosphate-dependent enzyme, partial [Actinomycetia bacterium]|nr:aminotransferase class III-fold pyridoxal phosphate-dependent enzyme [Actinomycetes bacterium]
GLEAPEHYFRDAYALTRAAGGLCIADEVQPGFARTGPMWGFLHDDVVPDIVTFGKPAGNGFPLAGIITSREIMTEFERRNAYFNTFGGSPVAAAVGGAVLDEIENRDLCNRVVSVGNHLQAVLEQLMDKHKSIGSVRGRGLYRGVELVTDRDTKEPATDLACQIPDAMKEAGVLMGITGSRGNVLKIRPPLVFDEANADQLAETLDSVLVKLEPSS